MTRPRLTPHQREVHDDIVRTVTRLRRHDPTVRIGIVARRLRRHDDAARAARLARIVAVGSSGALIHLCDKGYLSVVVDDYRAPIYTLTEPT